MFEKCVLLIREHLVFFCFTAPVFMVEHALIKLTALTAVVHLAIQEVTANTTSTRVILTLVLMVLPVSMGLTVTSATVLMVLLGLDVR